MENCKQNMDSHRLLLTLLIFSPVLLLIFRRRRNTKKGSKHPPSAYVWHTIGNIFKLDVKKPHLSLAHLAESLGPLFSLKLGSRLVFVASSVEAAREVYKVHDRELSGRFVLQVHKRVGAEDNTLIAIAGDCNKRWKFLRDISHSELFSSQALESQSKLRVQKVREMLQFLSSKEGEVVAIVDIIFATLSNSLSMSMTSRDIIRNWENIGEARSNMRGLPLLARPGIGDLFPTLACVDFSTKRKAVEYNKIFRALWGDILAERKAGERDGVPERRQDLLDVLIQNSWEDSQIFEFLSEFFASMDTTSTATEWAMTELIRNQEVLLKLREELQEATEGGRLLRECNLTKLSYLQACIKETLRLHPPLPLLVPRAAVETCKLMNYDVPRDCLILTNAYALGRDPNTWEDPLGFRPERFFEKSVDVKGANYELLPFGSGRRICAGYPWALKQIQLILASLVLAFDCSIPGHVDPANLDMDEKFSNVLLKKKTLLLIPKKRCDFNIE